MRSKEIVSDDDLIVTVADMRATGRCVGGSRRWVDSQGLDWRTFVKEGLPAARLMATGDHLIDAVVQAARIRVNGQE